MKKDKNNITKDNSRNGKNFFAKNRIIIGVAMLVVSLILGLFVLPKAIQGGTASTVYAFKTSVKAGTTISMDMLNKTTSSDLIVVASARNQSEIESGKLIARYDISEGEYLTKNNSTTGGGTNDDDIVPAGKQLIAVPVTSISSSVSYKIRGGDIIRFYTVFTNLKKETIVEVPAVLDAVKIYDVYDADGISCQTSGANPSSITFIVDANQATEIVKRLNTTNVYFSLLTSGDEAKSEELLSAQDKVLAKINGGEDVDDIQIDETPSLDFEVNNGNEETTANTETETQTQATKKQASESATKTQN